MLKAVCSSAGTAMPIVDASKWLWKVKSSSRPRFYCAWPNFTVVACKRFFQLLMMRNRFLMGMRATERGLFAHNEQNCRVLFVNSIVSHLFIPPHLHPATHRHSLIHPMLHQPAHVSTPWQGRVRAHLLCRRHGPGNAGNAVRTEVWREYSSSCDDECC